MSFTTPEVISCLAIVISLVMGLGGFLATLLTVLLGFLIKRMVTTIENQITTLSDKFEAMIVNKEAAHNNIYSSIKSTEDKFDEKITKISDKIEKVMLGQRGLETAFRQNIITSKTDTHRGL